MRFTSLIRRLPRRVSLLAMASVFAIGVGLPATVLAAPATPAAPCNVQCVIAFGNQRIDDRLGALTKLHDHITDQQSKGHITSDQSNSLTSDVSTNQSGLTTLKTKLDAETDVTAARQDVKNIYEQFRIFAVVIPRDNHTLWLNIGGQIDATLRGKQSTISDAISKAPASEQAQLNALFTDYQNQLTEAESQMSAGNGILPSLTPDNFNNARTTYETNLTDLRNDTRTAARDLHTAAQDLHKIVAILKGTSSTTPATATPTA